MRTKLDKTIEAAYYRRCSGVQISLLDIPRVFAEGKRAAAAGEDIEAAIVAFVETVRTN